jgi:hypothetical protein
MEASTVLSAPDTATRNNTRAMTGWMKFVGVMTIIGGCLQILSIVGLVIAWLPIWMGVILVRAGSKAREYADKGDFASLEGMTGQLKTYFTISGIMIIVSFAATIVAVAIWAALFAAGALSSPGLLDYFSRCQ